MKDSLDETLVVTDTCVIKLTPAFPTDFPRIIHNLVRDVLKDVGILYKVSEAVAYIPTTLAAYLTLHPRSGSWTWYGRFPMQQFVSPPPTRLGAFIDYLQLEITVRRCCCYHLSRQIMQTDATLSSSRIHWSTGNLRWPASHLGQDPNCRDGRPQ